MTPDLPTAFRGEAKLLPWAKFDPKMLIDQVKGIMRTPVFLRTLNAKHSIFPRTLFKFIKQHDIKVIHCNHYFNLSAAERIKRLTNNPQVVCETQDIQTRHLIKTDLKHPITGVVGSYESYFKEELNCSELADDFVHLNEEEYDIFSQALPKKRHYLIYPSVERPSVPIDAQPDIDFLIVASANMPNYYSLVWFLDEVWDDQFNGIAKLRIVGNIDHVFQTEKDDRVKRYGPIFLGRVKDVGEWYAKSKAVLAPVTHGQGISMKTVEAFSYGKPFLFSPMALRGFGNEPVVKSLTGLCETAAQFKAKLKQLLSNRRNGQNKHFNTQGLSVFETLFAPEVYVTKIMSLLHGDKAR